MRVLSKPSTIDRSALVERYRANRERSSKLFDLVRDAMYERPLELRHPFVFYLGHIPAFHFNTLAKHALGYQSFHADFDLLFRRGIDPDSSQQARSSQALWPAISEVSAYAAKIDGIIESILMNAELEDAGNPYLARSQAVYTVLEHEEMHQETLMYIINRLEDSKKHMTSDSNSIVSSEPALRSQRIRIPGGRVTLGAQPDEIVFGWDNEFNRVEINVAAFELDSLPVTNGEFLRFVERQDAAAPASWIPSSQGWMQRTAGGVIPLQMSWPAYVSLDAALSYAEAAGARIMTEAEYQRAAFGDPIGHERRMPWGDAEGTAEHGNFGFRRYDPEPVGMRALGASAWGVQELVGNGWEWTSSNFAALPGFTPMASYPEYSADFFDGKHAVLKGASPVTASTLLRPSLRNWFRKDYPYAYTKFRLAYST